MPVEGLKMYGCEKQLLDDENMLIVNINNMYMTAVTLVLVIFPPYTL
jgi:hypothetical protein